MTFIGKIDPLTATDDAVPDLERRIDALLRVKLSRLKLPPDIKLLFKRRIGSTVRRTTTAWCNWVALLVLLNLAFDGFMVPPSLIRLTILFRLCLCAGFIAGGLLFRKEIAVSLAPLYIGLPCVLCIIFAGVIGLLAHDTLLLCRYLNDALIVCATAIMFVGLDMTFSLGLAAAVLPAIAMVIALSDLHPAGTKLQVMFFDACLLTALIYGRHVQNLVQMRMFLLNIRDELRNAEARIRHEKLSSIAYTDKLTEIPNRRYFDETCAGLNVNAQNLLPLSICMIDIDHFKLLNDKLGDPQGDRCLKRVAAAIRANLRGQQDIAARYGGEEFVLLLPGTDLGTACGIAERVRAAVQELEHPNPGSPHEVVTVSIGVAVWQARPLALPALMQAADQALYRAKITGRNRVST
jgi:diguanylate cyclase (GGDEF)-like protein